MVFLIGVLVLVLVLDPVVVAAALVVPSPSPSTVAIVSSVVQTFVGSPPVWLYTPTIVQDLVQRLLRSPWEEVSSPYYTKHRRRL
jgi:hypothetical protein